MPDPLDSSSETELRARVEQALAADYEIEREIGRGGMGIVYLARDRRLKRSVAVKLLPPELAYRSDIRSRFLREAETAAQLNHPNIVPIYSVGERDNLVFFVMAYVHGENLGKRLQDQGRLAPEETRRILCEVADALAYAHARDVIHRDIKPDNILLDAESGRAMVTDFGIARAISDSGDSRLTATGTAIGTPAYMSPEQCAGDRDIDGRSDLYSLGVVGFQMLAGEPPFRAGSTPALLVKHLSEEPPQLEDKRADAPSDLVRGIMLLLQKDPAARFPDAAALSVALRHGTVPELVRGGSVFAARGRVREGASTSAAGMMDGADTADAEYMPLPDERARWTAPAVERFRRKLKFYGALTPVLLVISLVSDGPWFGIAVLLTIYISYRYAKLWAEGYDWRDVFRQPHHRMLIEVASETIEDVQGLMDGERRRAILERARQRRLSGGPQRSPASPLPARGAAGVDNGPADAGEPLDADHPRAAQIRQATLDRDEILRLVESMPKSERGLVRNVVPAATALLERIQSLAVSVAELERNVAPDSLARLNEEIDRLEGEANPFDQVGSGLRVRRLAFLKRQRRTLADLAERHARAVDRLESCVVALQTMRFDVVRLRAGAQSHDHVTSLAMDAMSLARDVENLVYAADEVSRVTGRAAPDRL